jgi:tRNA(fMet)-specific endonuclease VapC
MDRLRRHQDHLATASIVWHELLYGALLLADSAKRGAIERYAHEVVARTMPILPYDERAAAWHAAERARLAHGGRTPPFADGQIAAIAKVNELVLVTGNVQDYRGFEGLSLEDWR